MPRGRIALFLILAVSATRAADIAVTWKYTPSLHLEGNPLVAVWGHGWGTVLAVNAVAVLLICGGLLDWSARPIRYAPNPEIRTARQFAKWAYCGSVCSWPRFLWRFTFGLPTDKRLLCHLVAVSLALTLIAASIWAVIAWELMLGFRLDAFRQQYWNRFYPFSAYVPILAIWPFMIVRAFAWEYASYRAQVGPPATE
jgi:hypothetical protein